MPWKETRVEEERLKFIVASLDKESGWSMSELCAAFGVSRKSGYKWLQRYRDAGLDGLRERRRAPCATAAAQQHRFTRFRTRFNRERPHEALHDTVPAQWYRPSLRAYPPTLAAVEYPGHFEVRRVRTTGEIKWQGACVYLSEALVGEPVGLDAVSDWHWKITFGPIELGLFDTPTRKLLAYTRPTRRDRAEARAVRAVVEHSSRPSGSFRSPQPLQGSPEKD